MRIVVFVTALALTVARTAAGEPPGPETAAQDPRASVEAFTAHFLESFENLDLDAFIECFASDATVFFPTPEPPERFDGKKAIRDHFAIVFAAIREGSSAKAPPYHHLAPQKLSVKILSRDSALVTFQLENKERIARRTLVLIASPTGWQIEHLHASNMPTQR